MWISVVSLSASAQENLSGDWHGQINTPVGKLALLFYITRSVGAGFSGDLESDDQAHGQKIPLAMVNAAEGKLSLTVPAIGGSYEGAWQEAGHAWVGIFKQGIPSSFR